MENLEIDSAIKLLKAPEGFLYAGLPKFRALFGRDSIISSIQLLDYDPEIAVSTLEVLSRYQGKRHNQKIMEEKGKILHEYQQDKELIKERLSTVPWIGEGKNYFSVDSTPLFLILFAEYARRRNLPKPSDVVVEAGKEALEWIVNFGLKNGLLSYNRAMKGAGLQSQSWRDGAGFILDSLKDPVSVIGTQGYAYEALMEGSDVLADTGKITRGSDLYVAAREAARNIKERLDDLFYIEETGFYALAIDGDGVAQKIISSDPGHLLFSGILSRSQEDKIVGRIFEKDLLTDYGIRCISSKSEFFDEKAYQRGSVWPHDNFIIAYGLDKRGYGKESKEIKERLIEGLRKLKGFPEYFGVERNGRIMGQEMMRIRPCHTQAWTVGAYYYCIR